MKLRNLNRLVAQKIEASERPLVEFADELGVSLQSFRYKYKNGNLEWEEIRRLKLPIKFKEFSEALSKDFSQKVTMRAPAR